MTFDKNINQIPPFSSETQNVLEETKVLLNSFTKEDFILNFTEHKDNIVAPDRIAEVYDQEKDSLAPVHTALMLSNLLANPEEKHIRTELEKYIKSQAKSQAPSQVITPDITIPAAPQNAPTQEAKKSAPAEKLSIPVEKGDVFKSDTTEYTVRGFAPNGGIQYKDSKNGNGVLGVQKFNEEIAKGRLVKQEAVAAPETLAAPLEQKATPLPEVTLTLPTGEFVVKRGDEIAKESNAALYERITSKLAKKPEREVEKYTIKSTFIGERGDVVIRIVPTYSGGTLGEPIGLAQKWLESVPKPRQATEKIEADHVQIDGITLNIGDTLPQNIATLVNEMGPTQFDTWTIDRIFYQSNRVNSADEKQGIPGGMRMGLTALDGKKISVRLGDLREKLQQKKSALAGVPSVATASAEITPNTASTPETFDQQAEIVRLQELSTEIFAQSDKQKQVELLLAVFPEYEALVKQFGPETLMRETMKQLGIEIPQTPVAQTIDTGAAQIPQAPVAQTIEATPSPETYSPFIQFKHKGPAEEIFIDVGTTIKKDTHPAAYAIFNTALAEQGIPESSSITLNKVSVRNEIEDKKKVTVRTAYVTLDDGKEYTILQKDLYLVEKVSQPVTATPSPETEPSAPIALDAELAQEVASLVEETTQAEPAEEVPTPDATAQSFEAPTPAPEEVVGTQTSPEQEPVAEFSTDQIHEAIEHAIKTLDEKEKLESSNFKVGSAGEGGLVLSFKQTQKRSIIGTLGQPSWDITASLYVQDGRLNVLSDTIKLSSDDQDIMEESQEHKAAAQEALTNLTEVLLMSNDIPTETHKIDVKDGRIVVYKK